MAVDVEEAGRHAEAHRVDRPRSACTGQIAARGDLPVLNGKVAPEGGCAIAQAANDLLTIQNVEASFVAVQVGTGVNISARSLGAVNVQVIMEALGGGGHQTMAAAQLKHITPEAARARIQTAIDQYRASQKKTSAEPGPEPQNQKKKG